LIHQKLIGILIGVNLRKLRISDQFKPNFICNSSPCFQPDL